MSNTPVSLLERYLARVQHRVIVNVMRALAAVCSSDHMDDHMRIIAQHLGQPAPNDDETKVFFEDALSAMIASYARSEMRAARANLHATYEISDREQMLRFIDPLWDCTPNYEVVTTRSILDLKYFVQSAAAQGSDSPPTVSTPKCDADNEDSDNEIVIEEN